MEDVASNASRSSVLLRTAWGRTISLLTACLFFFVGIELLETSFELMGSPTARSLLEATSNPSVGLFIGILATSLVQSSSTVTSMTVAVAAGGGLSIQQAIPIVMGANIGTSVTSTVVSFGSVTRKGEFRRAMAGATVHDMFNLLAVGVLMPMELVFGVVSRPAAALTEGLAGIGGLAVLSSVDYVLEPLANVVVSFMGDSGLLVLVVGLVLVFAALRLLIWLLRALFLGRFEGLLDRYIFDRPLIAFGVGIGLTFLVQSSSITTSLTVPLVAAGILTVVQIYPFVLGANVGTTLTALLAALATGAPAALTVAFAHLAFNVLGMLIFFPIRPLRNVPVHLAEALGALCERNRWWAVGYVAAVFFIIPLTVIVATRGGELRYRPATPDTAQEETASPAHVSPPVPIQVASSHSYRSKRAPARDLAGDIPFMDCTFVIRASVGRTIVGRMAAAVRGQQGSSANGGGSGRRLAHCRARVAGPALPSGSSSERKPPPRREDPGSRLPVMSPRKCARCPAVRPPHRRTTGTRWGPPPSKKTALGSPRRHFRRGTTAPRLPVRPTTE